MKKFIAIVIAVIATAGIALAADITQTAGVVSQSLPRVYFYDQMNEAMYALTKTDVPAIITKLNAADTVNRWSGVITNKSVGFTNVVFVSNGSVTNVSYTGTP